jgi:hypothetical protein
MASQLETEFDKPIPELNLSSVGPNLFIGHYEGVPFRMEVVVNSLTLGLLFHTRFAQPKSPVPENPPVAAETLLHQLIAEKKADYSADQKQAWFNLFDARELIERGELLHALKEFAASLKSYVDFDDQLCFACKTNKADQPVYHSDALHLICDGCHANLNQRAEKLMKVAPGSLFLSLGISILGAIPAGIIWAVLWIVLIRLLSGVRMPSILWTVCYAAMGAAVALPIGWLLKRIPHRPIRFANAINILGCVAAAVTGEFWMTLYYILQATPETPSLIQIGSIWVALMIEASGLYIIGKLICLGMLCATMLDWAKPKVSLVPNE